MYTRNSSHFCLVFALSLCLSAPLFGGEAEDAYAVAVGHYSDGRWKLAEQEFTTFLERYPEHASAPTATLFRAESQVQQGNQADARRGFVEFLDGHADHQYALHARFRAAETAYLTDDYDTARGELERFHERHPNDKLNAYALSYLGDICLAQGVWAKAARWYADSLRRFPQGPLAEESRFGLGRVQELQGELEAALATYAALAAARGRLADDAQLQIGVSHYNRKQYEEAGVAFQTLATGFPDSDLRADAEYWMGMCRVARRQWPEAIKILWSVAQENPRHKLIGSMLFWLAEAHRHAGNVNQAVACYQLVRQQRPDDAWADDSLRAEILLALKEERFEDAARLAEQFEATYPESPAVTEVRQVLGRSLLKEKKFDRAVQVLTELVRSVPELSQDAAEGEAAPVISAKDSTALRTSWYHLSLAHLGLGEHGKALEALAEVRPLNDEQELRAGVWAAEATAHIGLEQYADAVQPLKQYLAAEPNGTEASQCRVQLIVALARSGHPDEAMQLHAALPDADKRHPAYLPAIDGLAEAAFVAERYDEAAQLFTVLTAEDAPPQAAAKGHSGLGWSYFRRGEFAAAAETFAMLVQSYPEDLLAPEAALMQGRCWEQLGRDKEALAAYIMAFDTYANSTHAASALFQAARLQERSGERAAAVASLERLVREKPDFAQIDGVHYQLAWLLGDLGRNEQAQEHFQRLADEHEDSPYRLDALYRLAERAIQTDRFDHASQWIEQILQAECSQEIRLHTLYLKGQLAGATHRWEEVLPPMQELLDEFPDSPLVGAARYWIAESHFRCEQYDQAAEGFSELAEAFPHADDQWMATVHLRRAQISAQRKQWRAAYEEALSIEEQFPKFRQQYEVDYVIGRCLAMQAKFTEARQRYERVIRSAEGGGTETAAMAQWMIGETYMHQRDYDNALRAYDRVDTLFAFPHWQAAALLQAGKCHQIKGEKEEAAKLLAQVVADHSDSPFAEDASKRLKALDQRGL